MGKASEKIRRSIKNLRAAEMVLRKKSMTTKREADIEYYAALAEQVRETRVKLEATLSKVGDV